MLTKMEARLEAENEKFEVSRNTLASRKGLMVCLGKTEATYFEANPEETQYEVVHREIPKENAAVETGRAPKKRQRDRHLAEKRRQTQRSGPGEIVDTERSWSQKEPRKDERRRRNT
jgi:hypothetical protein